MKNVLLVMVMVLGLASQAQAKETLSVAFVFDRNTINLNSSQRNSLADDYMDKLNYTFKNSGLSSYIAFKKVAVAYRPISKSGDNLKKLHNRYYDYNTDAKIPKPRLTLHYYQRYYHADVVIGIVDFNENVSGISAFIPKKSFGTPKKANTPLLAFGDFGICFVNYRFRNQKEQPAHEVGHSFGFRHGKAAEGFIDSNLVEKYANGYGVTKGLNYGTVMAGRYLTSSERGIENRFSNPYSYKCGYWSDTNKCGDSTANAVTFILKYAKYFNKRGDWYE